MKWWCSRFITHFIALSLDLIILWAPVAMYMYRIEDIVERNSREAYYNNHRIRWHVPKVTWNTINPFEVGRVEIELTSFLDVCFMYTFWFACYNLPVLRIITRTCIFNALWDIIASSYQSGWCTWNVSLMFGWKLISTDIRLINWLISYQFEFR